MDLQKKFELGKKSRTYQRIDAEYSVNIFLGYNEDGLMSMVITEDGIESRAKSSKLINVRIRRREDKKLAVSFDLLDDAYKSMFVIFCKDIISVCEKSGAEMAISSALMRWKYWKEMFGIKKTNLLEKAEIKGLIGELIELDGHFMKKYDEETAINSWMGPLLGHKDFEIENTWHEIKTVSESATQVTINSIEQLESEDDGHLVVIKLEDTSTVNAKAINLNQMVLRIIDQIRDPDVLSLFRTRLDNMGYEADPEYDKINFIYKSTNRYKVDSNFPRLSKNELNSAISNVKYSIILNGILEFLED